MNEIPEWEEPQISADCPQCEYFEGYCQSDGTPYCSYEDGYENCPYFEEGKIIMSENLQPTKDGVCNVNIDMGEMQERIIIAFKNTVERAVNAEVSRIAREQFESQIKQRTAEILEQKITASVNELFSQEVTVGGGWGEKSETMTREQYLTKVIGDKLSKGFDKDNFDKKVAAEVQTQIDKFSGAVKNNVNTSIKKLFDASMQQNLTNSVVNLLMSNETYQTLSGSMQNLLDSGK